MSNAVLTSIKSQNELEHAWPLTQCKPLGLFKSNEELIPRRQSQANRRLLKRREQSKALYENEEGLYKAIYFVQHQHIAQHSVVGLQPYAITETDKQWETPQYGSELWHLSNAKLLYFGITWRKSVRKIWNLSNTAHCYLLPLLFTCQIGF